ncbi:MAG TPA: DUF2071 domain-containing protein [Planctomycetota bacterium]|nr:DUF2071 domain-containing protein [Planctomycetota bacterium]
MTSARPFLTARWRHLALLNYEVDPSLVRPLVPPGTEMDTMDGKNYVSLVGFMFLDTRVRGWAIPFHRNFEEVNLRIYVRRKAEEGWRRGVTFVKEIVPRAAIAWVARTVYGENYVALPMSHRWSAEDPPSVRYAWRSGGREMSIELEPEGPYRPITAASPEEFIAEHYWGYTAPRRGETVEYRVEHPRWRIASARKSAWEGDAAALYGPAFASVLAGRPASAFLAEGSEVAVHEGTRI